MAAERNDDNAQEQRIVHELETFAAQRHQNHEKPWGFLPPYANEENRQLHAAILELESDLEQLDIALKENSESVKNLEQHLNGIKNETQYTNARLLAKRKEEETEEHLIKLTERERGRLEAEKEKTRMECKHWEEKSHQTELSIFRSKQRLDAFKLEMNFNADELGRWVAEREKEEKDQRILEKYKRQDEAMVKDLNLQIHKLDKQILQIRDELLHEIVETQATQLELNKTADAFREAHSERLKLLKRWDETVATTKQREQAIDLATSRLREQESTVSEKQVTLDSLVKDVENEAQKNTRLDRKLQSLNRELGSVKATLHQEEERTAEAQDKLRLTQTTHDTATKELIQKKQENETTRQQLQKLKSSVEKAMEKFHRTKIQVEEEKRRLEQVELKDDALQSKLQMEEKQLKEAEKEVTALVQEQYKKGQILFEEKQKETALVSNIAGIAAQDKNAKAKIAAMDEEILKQEEVLYNVNFKIVMLQRKIERIGGVRSVSETKELNQKIQSLTNELERVNTEHTMVTNQFKKSQHELSQAQRTNKQQRINQESIEQSISQMQMETDMIQRSIAQKHEEKENVMIEQDTLQLEIQKLKAILQHKANEVWTLERKKALMQSDIAEKKSELRIQQDCMKYELKNLRDDIHRVKLDLTDRQQRSDKLQSKYETLSSKKVSVYDDEPKPLGYYLIRATQEKEELKKEGVKLAAKIKTVEQEVAGLENALRGIVMSNQAYKASIGSAPDCSLLAVHDEMRETMDRCYDTLKFKREEESAILSEIKAAEQKLSQFEEERTQCNTVINDRTQQMMEAERQLHEQTEKEERAKRRSLKLNDAMQSKEPSKAVAIQLISTQDVNRSILLDLKVAGLNRGCQDCLQTIQELESAGIVMPNSNRSTPRTIRPNSTESQQSRPVTGSSARSVTLKTVKLDL